MFKCIKPHITLFYNNCINHNHAGTIHFSVSALPGGYFGSWNESIFLGNPRCKGNESNILDCDSSYIKAACPKRNVFNVDCSRGNTYIICLTFTS